MHTGLGGYLVLGGVTVAALLLFAAAMVARRLLAPRAPGLTKQSTYESGVDPVGGGWAQTHVRYLAYAFLYVVFAVDAAYLFPWALVLRDQRVGVASLVEMGIFISVILVGLLHFARRRALSWDDDD
ncbi:NADH-quinone oxidoreductase subunit A [Metallococcus carri]|uniref:NADH-quinone oxidoreductase subunit A n=1 Tax=Metallococcus carri TaxID=1656884 RepID=UPI002E2BC8D5|nr:NADH-quinone oxidoreductase subunit A [Metallococcus carri]